MTDKEIIKALECCYKDGCKECPLWECKGDCFVELIEHNVLDLINRQQAEIERLTINMNAFGLGMKQEKERADTIRAEAIKEFAERLKEAICKIPQHHFTLAGVIWLIKKFVKEMVGEDK